MLASLAAAKMYNDTLVLMTTDNGGMVRFAVEQHDADQTPRGAASVGDNYPLRGSKAIQCARN